MLSASSALQQLDIGTRKAKKDENPAITIKGFTLALTQMKKLDILRMKQPQLQELDISDLKRLSGEGIGCKEAEYIATNLPQLTWLSINDNAIGKEGAYAIAGKLSKLEFLSANSCNIQDAGAEVIAKLTLLNNLNLKNNGITARGIDYLCKLHCLISLDVCICRNNSADNSIGDEGVELICKNLSSLQLLRVDNGGVTELGASAISCNLMLTFLGIANNRLRESGALAIAQGMPWLTTLYIDGNTIGDTAADAIAELLVGINVLGISNNALSAACIARIRAQLRNVRVQA